MSENEKRPAPERVAQGAYGVATYAGAGFYGAIATAIGGPVAGLVVASLFHAAGSHNMKEAIRGDGSDGYPGDSGSSVC